MSESTTNYSFDFWDMANYTQAMAVNGVTTPLPNKTILGSASAPNHFDSGTIAATSLIEFAAMPQDKYYLDNIQMTVSGITETLAVANNGSTRYTTGTVSGLLATALASGQYVEVFSNGSSLGHAIVNGTNWTISDTIAAGGENYTAKVMNANGTEVAASNSYAVNTPPTSVPKLTILDNANTDLIGGGVGVIYTFQFDQAVTGFTATDVLVTNGTAGTLTSVDAKTWTMMVTSPTSGANVTTVSVADGSFTATTGGASGIGASDTQAYDAAATDTPYAYLFYGNTLPVNTGDGDDNIVAANSSGIDVVNLGAGTDSATINSLNIAKLAVATGNASFDGGLGVDTLIVNGTGLTLDLTNVTVAGHVKNFETIDITGTGNNTLKLDLNAVLNMSSLSDNLATAGVNESQMLVVNGNAGDALQLSWGINWATVTSGQTAASLNNTLGSSYHFTAGHTYSQYSYSGATLFVDELITKTNV